MQAWAAAHTRHRVRYGQEALDWTTGMIAHAFITGCARHLRVFADSQRDEDRRRARATAAAETRGDGATSSDEEDAGEASAESAADGGAGSTKVGRTQRQNGGGVSATDREETKTRGRTAIRRQGLRISRSVRLRRQSTVG